MRCLTSRWSRTLDRGFPFAVAPVGRPQAPLNSALGGTDRTMDHLSVFAEVGVGFAGFTAIFLIFARRDGSFEPHDGLRIQAIFTASFMVLFMSALPLVLSESDMSEQQILQFCSALAALVTFAIYIQISVAQLKLPAESRKKIGFANNLIAHPLGIGVIVSLASVILDFGWASPSMLYLLAIVFLLGIGTSNFVALALQRFR